jgi:Sulfotransferase family
MPAHGPPAGGPQEQRLVPAPVFLLGSIRSGSTLLRCLLDTHSRIRAPHELHLTDLRVAATTWYVRLSMDVAGLSVRDFDHLLWDRILHRELQRSGKEIIVDKTPGNVLAWSELRECWPEARFIFLLRHPVHVEESAVAMRPDRDPAESRELVATFLTALSEARQVLPGLTVRYEELTHDPGRVTADVCRYLGVEWEPQMLDYGRVDHGPFVDGVGDFSDRISSGRVLAGRPLPGHAGIPARLASICESLGYLPPG